MRRSGSGGVFGDRFVQRAVCGTDPCIHAGLPGNVECDFGLVHVIGGTIAGSYRCNT
jgi:hypothetical protein